MAKKKVFALRVDPEVMSALEKWAADEFRSTNGQIEYLASKALKEAGTDRYLLRHETASRKLYEHLHPSFMSFDNRRVIILKQLIS